MARNEIDHALTTQNWSERLPIALVPTVFTQCPCSAIESLDGLWRPLAYHVHETPQERFRTTLAAEIWHALKMQMGHCDVRPILVKVNIVLMCHGLNQDVHDFREDHESFVKKGGSYVISIQLGRRK